MKFPLTIMINYEHDRSDQETVLAACYDSSPPHPLDVQVANAWVGLVERKRHCLLTLQTWRISGHHKVLKSE